MNDSIARNVFFHLVKDFRHLLGDNSFAHKALEAFGRGVVDYREYAYPHLGEVPIMRFKAYWQLQQLFKRYTFASDKHTVQELSDLTYAKYLSFQKKRALYVPFRTSTKAVLQEARKVAKSILTLPPDYYRDVKVGRRAEHGAKLNEAFFDRKLADPKGFTCSSSLVSTLRAYRKYDPHFNRVYNRMRRSASGPLRLNEDALSLTLVPKSWKIKRSITPLTTFGLFWSFGVGGYVERCLRMSGLDIKRLQQTHKSLAKRFSKTRSHVTADLSSASDSLRSDILNAVLPRHLLVELRKTYVRRVIIDSKEFYTESVLPMGNGATFPVETLVFYCLIRAIGNLLNVKGVFSAYGDDLIYPQRIHAYVCSIFTDLGIEINVDKTFARSSSFRESCGGDYYHGVDVRPFLFPEEALPQGRLRQLQYLYKICNTLRERWSEHELPMTFRYLYHEILYRSKEIYLVPPSYPETSGLTFQPVINDWVYKFCTPKIGFADGSRFISFKSISNAAPKRRAIVDEYVYYWYELLDSSRLRETVFPRKGRNFHHFLYLANTLFGRQRAGDSFDLKSIDGVWRKTEPIHEDGLPRVCASSTSSWT